MYYNMYYGGDEMTTVRLNNEIRNKLSTLTEIEKNNKIRNNKEGNYRILQATRRRYKSF